MAQTTSEVLNKMAAMWNEHINELGGPDVGPANKLEPLDRAAEIGLQTTLGWVLQSCDQDSQLGSNYGWQEVTMLDLEEYQQGRLLADITEIHRKICYTAEGWV
jgi:hypothetical protein